VQPTKVETRKIPQPMLAMFFQFKKSREICKQVSRRDRKRLCQLDDIFQGYIPFSAFNPADVIPVQPSPFGQFFLRIAPFFAELPQP
jgi:hypothetical protein